MYAIIEFKGKQYRIEKGARIKVALVEGEEGDKIDIDTVLLLSDTELKVGKPYVDGAKVQATLKKSARDRKIIVFKYKPKKDYRRKNGHRQDYSIIEIDDISA
jgi:large subunit ribosomal protein L21